MPAAKKKVALGKGLTALMGEAQHETGQATSETLINIEDIHPNPNQPRTHFDEMELQELADSISEHGVLQPLLVRRDGKGYQIIAGERRYQASKLAEISKVPVIVKDVDETEVVGGAGRENLQRYERKQKE